MKNDNLIRAIGFLDENLIARSEKHGIAVIENKVHRYNKKLIGILVAAIAAALVGFAYADRIQQFFTQYFGVGSNLSQYSQPVGKISIDQGLRMEVLTALNDGDNNYLFVDLTDETGDRLREEMEIDGWNIETVKQLGENVASMSGGNCRVISYDAKTKTATLVVHAIGSFPDEKTVFTLNSIFMDRVEFRIEDSEVNLFDLVTSSPGEFVPHKKYDGGFGVGYSKGFKEAGLHPRDITEVLNADALNIELPDYTVGHLSNIGYKDGYIHIQINPDNFMGNNELYVELQNIQTGERLSDFYSLSYGYGEPLEASLSAISEYREFTFYIGDLSNLKNYILHLDGAYYQNAIVGEWAIEFDVPEQMKIVEVPAGKVVPMDEKGMNISKITISPLSVIIYTSNKTDGVLQVAVIYKDGKRQEVIPNGEMYVHENGEQEWQFIGPFMDYQNLSSVEINGVRFDREVGK